MLYVPDVKSTQTLLTPEGVQILLLFITARFSVTIFLEKIDGKSIFRAFRQNKPYIGKNCAYCKKSTLVLTFHCRWLFVDIFGRINSNMEQQVINCGFFYWFSNENDDFVQHSENWHFSHFLIDVPQGSTNWL